MTVYVDNYKAPFGRMVMCHMIADNTAELLQMADRIGVDRRWIQKASTWQEHFDICLSKREKAISMGAVCVSTRELVSMLRDRRCFRINK